MKQPFNQYQLLRILLAGAAILTGLCYLWWGEGTLAFVLPLMSICFLAIAVVSWREARAGGAAGWIALIPTLAAGLVAAFALIGTAVYFFA